MLGAHGVMAMVTSCAKFVRAAARLNGTSNSPLSGKLSFLIGSISPHGSTA